MNDEATVVSDNYSNHNLPVGAKVTLWDVDDDGVFWYTQGGDGDEVAIDPRDLSFPNGALK